MSQTEQMREALESILRYPKINEYIGNMLFNKAMQALAHVNETPKNEHGSDDVLKRAPLVRLTDEDIKVLQAFHNFNVCTTSDKDLVTFAHAIQDAMQEKNK